MEIWGQVLARRLPRKGRPVDFQEPAIIWFFPVTDAGEHHDDGDGEHGDDNVGVCLKAGQLLRASIEVGRAPKVC